MTTHHRPHPTHDSDQAILRLVVAVGVIVVTAGFVLGAVIHTTTSGSTNSPIVEQAEPVPADEPAPADDETDAPAEPEVPVEPGVDPEEPGEPGVEGPSGLTTPDPVPDPTPVPPISVDAITMGS